MIHALFEEQAERSPDRIAATFGANRLTYRELDLRADLLAHQLRMLGVKPGALVGLFVERSLELVVGMLGILKAGGAYVPLDPSHPPKRIALVLDDSRPLVLVTTNQLRGKLPPHQSREVLLQPARTIDDRLHSMLLDVGNPGDLAYVIYTSGSTGKPKGVEVEHGSVLNMLASMQRLPGFGPEDTMLAITTVAFDISVLEIFLPLVSGGRLVVAPAQTTVDAEALAKLIEEFWGHSPASNPQLLAYAGRRWLDRCAAFEGLVRRRSLDREPRKGTFASLRFALEHVWSDRDDCVVFRCKGRNRPEHRYRSTHRQHEVLRARCSKATPAAGRVG